MDRGFIMQNVKQQAKIKNKSSLDKKGFIKLLKDNWQLSIMALPGFIWLLLFMYRPMYGVLLAFKDYQVKLGILGSPVADPWYKYFEQFFSTSIASQVITNTLVLSGLTLIFTFPIPIVFALMVNQVRNLKFKKVVQTISYAPYFVSVVVVVGMMNSILSAKGFVNTFLGVFGIEPLLFMSLPEFFHEAYIISGVWSTFGFSSIIYIAALTSIDPVYYEAAQIDGAGRFKCIRYIDIPQILPTVILMLILAFASIMTVGYEKVYLMQSGINTSVSEVIATYVYKVGLEGAQFSYATAIGLFNSAVNVVLLISVNYIAKKTTKLGMF